MEYLTLAEVLVLHARLIQRTGGHGGVRDMGLLESAVARLQATFDQVELYPGVWHKAAVLMHALIRNHPFVDGNKRTALAAAALFLEVNGSRLVAGNEQALEFTRKVVVGGVELAQMASWFEAHCRPFEGK